MTLAGFCTMGFVLGLRHALEPDHLVAVSVMLDARRSSWAVRAGGLWGLGHTLMILVLGSLLLYFRRPLSSPWVAGFESLACLILIGLGARTLGRLWKRRLHMHSHEHDGRSHLHFHAHAGDSGPGLDAHGHGHPARLAGWQTFGLGTVHGLAGTGVVVLLVMASTPASPVEGMVYLAAFGAGSVLGMAAMAGLVSLSMRMLERRFSQGYAAALGTIGCTSVFLGGYLLWDLLRTMA